MELSMGEAEERKVEGRGWGTGGRRRVPCSNFLFLFLLQEQSLRVELSCLLSPLRSQIAADQLHSAQDCSDHV